MGCIRRRRRLAGLMAAACAAAGVATSARAADLALDIPTQARQSALMALARQAGVSMGFAPGARCDGRAGVAGRMDLDEALRRLLANSTCVAVRPDARTVVIRPRPLPAAAPAPPPPGTSAERQPTELGELVVTADRTESVLSASPYGLTAMSGAELQRRGVSDVADLSLIAAGVTVTNLGPGRDKVLLRGLSDGPLTGHTQATVGLYLGDLRLTYNAPDPDLPLIDVARVEVLRGPQGSLYGAGSIGGVLQIVPNAPDTTARSGRIAVGLGATAHGAGSSRFEGLWNQPLGDRAAVRIAAWSEVAGGYIDNRGLGLSNIDRSRRRGLRLATSWRPVDDLSLEATLISQAISNRDAQYATPEIGPLARATATQEPHDNDFLALSLAAHWTPAWGRVTFSMGAVDHEVGTTYDAAAAPGALVATGGPGRTFRDRNEIRSLISELRVTSVGVGRWRWTLGAFNALGDQQLGGALTPVTPGPAYTEARRDRLLEGAVFGETSFDLTPVLTVTAGARLLQARLKTRSEVEVGAAQRTFRGRTTADGFAPKLLMAYRPAPGLTIYASTAEGYRTPGLNTSGPPGQAFGEAGGAQPLRRYAGDELWSYETGARWRSARLGLTARLAVFQADWTDIQADLLLPSGLPYTANLGDGRSRGVELEATFQRGPLTLSGNMVRQDPELRHPAPGLLATPEATLPGVADAGYAATAMWTTPIGADLTLDLQASYTFVGHSRLTFDATTSPDMGGYGDVRLAAALSGGPWTARLSVDNALHGRGDTLAFGNPFAFRGQQQTTPQRPRTVSLSLARTF